MRELSEEPIAAPMPAPPGPAPLTDLPVNSSAIAVDPTNALVAYAGSSGLFKTTDGGNNWNALNIPVNSAFVRTIVFDPLTPSTMYVGSALVCSGAQTTAARGRG